MEQYQQRYQNLLEVFSGHGNSEIFEDFQRVASSENGDLYCPPATDNFTPCCQQAAVITRSLCDDPTSLDCEQQVTDAVSAFVVRGAAAGRRLFPDATLEDWAGCGQLQNNFQPSSMYVPRMSAQYSLALGFDEEGAAKRARFGLIGSSDGHQGRPGSKLQRNRPFVVHGS